MPVDVAKSPCNYCGEFPPLLQPKTICQTGKYKIKALLAKHAQQNALLPLTWQPQGGHTSF